MLVETRRKRRRAAMAAFTAADVQRTRRQTAPPPPPSPRAQPEHPSLPTHHSRGLFRSRMPVSTDSAILAAGAATSESPDATSRANQFSALAEGRNLTRTTRSQAPTHEAPSNIATPASSLITTPPLTALPHAPVDRRTLLSHANRMRFVMLDRLRFATLRRNRRCELLDEILQLKHTIQDLQGQIDATTRSMEAMDRLVQQMQRITSVCSDADARQLAADRDHANTPTTQRFLAEQARETSDLSTSTALARVKDRASAERRMSSPWS